MDLPLSKLFSVKLRHYLVIFEFKSLRRASEEIGVSQPALTKSLKGLEHELGVSLFLRSRSGLVATEAGDVLAKHLARFSDLAREAEIEISAFRGHDRGEIRIGAGQMWSWLFVPKIVEKFAAEYPQTLLEVTTGPMRDMMHRLRNDEMDIIVGDFDGVDVPKEFQMQRAWSPEFRAFSSADHPLLQQQVVQTADLVEYPWSGYVDSDVFQHNVRFWCRKLNLEMPNISVRASSLATLLRLTSAGSNIAMLPSELEAEARKWGLVPVGAESLEFWSVRTGSIIHERKSELAQYRRLLDLIQEAGSQTSEFLSASR